MNADSDADSDADAEFPSPCVDPNIVGDLVARERRTSGLALRADEPGRTYSYYDFITTSYKAGNVLRYLGVREGDEVLVVPEALPESVLTFFGAAQLGAVTRFADDIGETVPRAVVAPAEREDDFDLPPGHRLAVYGDKPTAPSTTHWETEVWSENPAVHPATVTPGDPLLAAAGRTYSHAEALAAASDTVADADLQPGTEVFVQGRLGDPGVVAAGLLAPIMAGATIVFPDPSETPKRATAESEGDVADVVTETGQLVVSARSSE